MALGWRKFLGLKGTDDTPSDHGPDVPSVGPRSYEVGDSIAGEYRVLDRFAGGMGFVYLVNYHDEDTPVVLKTLQRPENDSERAQFLREAEISTSSRSRTRSSRRRKRRRSRRP